MADDDTDRSPLSALASGFRKRTLVTARLGVSLGSLLAKKTFLGRKKDKAVDEEEAVKAATAMLEQLDGLKGLVMKFGQMASYLNPALPPRAQRILAKLQSDSRPMDWPQIEAVVRRELGAAPEELFEHFEQTPFAAASIGQVHRAIFEGREVAVKVQYPGVDRVLEADLKTVGRMFRWFFALSAMDTKGLLAELQDRIRQECDYEAEAVNQRLFGQLMASPRVVVPSVVEARSAKRVITSELVDGQGFNTFCDTSTQAARDEAGALIFETAFECIFHHCIYNADPHPGNYLFFPDGRVAFLDFGCVKRFSAEFIDNWKRLALTVLDGRRADLEEALNATGMVARPRRFDYDYHWEILQYIYQPFLQAEPFTFTHAYVAESFDKLMFNNPNKYSTAIPPDWLFVNRLQWGLNSVLAHLNATADWGALLRSAVEQPTQPVS